jgi:uncharacterized protein (DUF952 family)
VRILHLALAGDWDAALRRGRYEVSTRGVTLAQQGFVHASTPAQLPRVAAACYADAGPLVVLVLDVDALEAAGSAVRWEVPDDLDEAFPHVYGPVPVSAVVAEVPAEVDGAGRLVSDADLAALVRPSTGGASAAGRPSR